MEYTHIVVFTTADDKEYIYRTSDGMRIGGRQYATVVFGTEPSKSASHVFIDSESASKWLREVLPLNDLTASLSHIGKKVSVDIRSADPVGIVVPNGVGDEFMGTPQKIRRS